MTATPEPPADAQSAAFRDADEQDWAASEALLANAIIHEADDNATDSAAEVPSPDHYDAAQWDAARQQPKTPEEANRALRQRIGDPDAPDQPEHEVDYTQLDQQPPVEEPDGMDEP